MDAAGAIEVILRNGWAGVALVLAAVLGVVVWRVWRDRLAAEAALRADRDYWRSLALRALRVGEALVDGGADDDRPRP